jgi:hypothetical protein
VLRVFGSVSVEVEVHSPDINNLSLNNQGSSVTNHGNEEYEASAEGLLTVNANELAWSKLNT